MVDDRIGCVIIVVVVPRVAVAAVVPIGKPPTMLSDFVDVIAVASISDQIPLEEIFGNRAVVVLVKVRDLTANLFCLQTPLCPFLALHGAHPVQVIP